MKPPLWVFDELRFAGDEHLSPEYVSAYDRKAGTDPTEDVALFRELGLNKTSTVVDVGAGTGTFALGVAPFCKRVVAIDVSQAMIRFLAAKIEQLKVTNVEPVLAGFLSYEHRGTQADFIYSRNALHHLPDFWKSVALKRIADSLRPGGVLRLRDLVYSFGLDEVDQSIEAWLSGASKDPDCGWTRSELEAHIRDEYSTFSWLLEPMLQRAGFTIEHAEYSASRTYAAYLCVKRL